MTNIAKDGSVEFRFYRKDARRVSVVGDFADWCEAPAEMKPDGDGWWRLTLRLAAGEYLFRYVADGIWYTDYASYGVRHGEMGVDSVLVVPDLLVGNPGDPGEQRAAAGAELAARKPAERATRARPAKMVA